MFGPTENLKKLGTILDEGAELSRRKHLADFALSRYRKLWKNTYIPTKKNKIKIYNFYVRSILLYSCSTWVAKKNEQRKPKCISQALNVTVIEYSLFQDHI